MSATITRVRLAHQADFALGGWTVRPATREIVQGDDTIVVEPRVMQVLVALRHARGGVVPKDDLVEACWEGRMVGEDAINRVLSRLRRLAEKTGSFRIETIARVGYRLIAGEDAARAADEATPAPTMDRRHLLKSVAAGGIGAVALAAGGAWWLASSPSPPAGLSALLDKAGSALNYGTPEQNDAAVSIMREATRLYPRRAEAWGKLAIAYRQQGVNSRRPDALVAMNRAQAAARRAVEIDPGSADGIVVLTIGRGLWYASYADHDRRTRSALARFPDHPLARRSRSAFLFETGRVRESVAVAAPLVDATLPSPTMTSQAVKLWSAGRPDEAEALLDTLIARWPRHYSVWATRFQVLMFSGSIARAERMLATPPVGLDPVDLDLLAAQIRALGKREPRAIDAVLALFARVAATTPIKPQEAAIFAASVGRLDVAFACLDLLFVTAPALRAYRRRSAPATLYPHSGTVTYFLFEPPMQAVRADPRFDAIVTRLGLKAYWERAGAPDFRR